MAFFLFADEGHAMGVELLHLQTKCRLSNSQTACVKEFTERFGSAKIEHHAAVKTSMSEAGVRCIELHGCPAKVDGKACQHVYRPGDRHKVCPECGEDRYFQNGKPKEKVYHFPMMERLEALLKLSSFRKLLQVFKLVTARAQSLTLSHPRTQTV